MAAPQAGQPGLAAAAAEGRQRPYHAGQSGGCASLQPCMRISCGSPTRSTHHHAVSCLFASRKFRAVVMMRMHYRRAAPPCRLTTSKVTAALVTRFCTPPPPRHAYDILTCLVLPLPSPPLPGASGAAGGPGGGGHCGAGQAAGEAVRGHAADQLQGRGRGKSYAWELGVGIGRGSRACVWACVYVRAQVKGNETRAAGARVAALRKGDVCRAH